MTSFTPEQRARISAAKMGHLVSAETRAKISAAASKTLNGRPVSTATRRRISASQQGERGAQWAGELVGYGGAHKRHRATLPKVCEHCGRTDGRLDVALSHDAPEPRLRWCDKRSRFYSTDPADYMRLCRSCHLRYDRNAPALARA